MTRILQESAPIFTILFPLGLTVETREVDRILHEINLDEMDFRSQFDIVVATILTWGRLLLLYIINQGIHA